MELEKLKYPIGKFQKPENISKEIISKWIIEIKEFPERMKKEVVDLSETDLKMIYRPDGWSIKQVVHHCADSHMNAFIRHKLCLTENNPTIKPYAENLWAMQSDVEKVSIASSLMILQGVHLRWSVLLESLSEKDFAKTFVHPEHNKVFKLEESIGQYAWHGNHHLEHIKQAKKHKGVFNF